MKCLKKYQHLLQQQVLSFILRLRSVLNTYLSPDKNEEAHFLVPLFTGELWLSAVPLHQ